MALTTLESAFGTVEYDPDVIDEETVLGFLEAGQDRSVGGMEEEESDELPPDDLPPEVAAMLDNGATQDEAIEILRKAFEQDGFLQDDIPERELASMSSVESASLFEEAAAEIKAAPTLDEVDPAMAEETMRMAGPVLRFETVGTQAEVYLGDRLAFQMPVEAATATKLDKFVLFIQTVLDTINLFFALLGVGKAAERKWATKLSKKLGKSKEWLAIAKKAFGHFKQAYGVYKAKRDGGANTRKAALDTTGDFAGAFLGFAGVIFKKCLKIVKAVLGLIFGSWREIAKIVLKLLAALAQWVGVGWAKLAKAVIDAILAVIALWEDVEAWQRA